MSAASLLVHVRVADQLTNAGTRALAYLDVALPAIALDAATLSIMVDGQKALAAPLTKEPGAPLRIRFNPEWSQRQTQTFIFDYDLVPGGAATSVAAAADAFYLADTDTLPRWLPPAGVFVTADSEARRQEFDVTVPSTFRVAAAGRELKPKREGDLVLHRFRLSGEDFPLFVVAGRYEETRVRTPGRDVIFWTLHELDSRAANNAAVRLSGSVATYQKNFGAAGTGQWPLQIVEVPPASPSASAVGSEFATAPFPYGALLDGRAFAKGIDDEAVLELADSELARTWFGWVVRPAAGSETLLGRGAALYAAIMAAEARGGDAARRQAISRVLATYDRVRGVDANATTKGTPASDAYKSALFWVELEDLAGKEPLQRAMRHIFEALAGKEVNIGDLRSALESETGRDLAGIFRAWPNRSDIPPDFRTRYALAP